jgi:type II secretory pathway pseudopilin PulG
MPRPSTRDDRGETLVELLVALVILGTAVVALIGAVATGVRMSDIHRKEATAGSYVRSFGEAVNTAVNATPTGYTACATITTYTGAYTVPDTAGYVADVTTVTYWNGTAFVATCTTDRGVQKLTLRVRSKNRATGQPDGRASETLDIVIRKPCRSGETACS